MKIFTVILLIAGTGAGIVFGMPIKCPHHEADRGNKLGAGVSYNHNNRDYLSSLLSDNIRLLNKIKYIIQEAVNRINSQDAKPSNLVSSLACPGCKAAVGILQYYIDIGKSTKEITEQIDSTCSTFHIESTSVCNGLTKLFGLEIVYLLKNVRISPQEICGFILEDICPDEYSPYHDWEVVFPPVSKPTPHDLPLPKENAPRLKVLHLSDNHYDPEYVEGMNANCNEPLCCRAGSGRPSNSTDKAGKWGDYRKCDTPKRTIDHLLKHISTSHQDIDYIIWTGDLPPHDIWNQTRNKNLNTMKETAKQLTEHFSGIPIFPALGNHESVPVNMFPPRYLDKANISMSWLYNELDSVWRQWIPANVSKTVRRGAFYSILIKPGFRIISLNMNYCSHQNWWLIVDSTDPDEELQWLVHELDNSEFLKEKVHIIGHIPPGHPDCLKVWSQNFYRIIARYESTITAQFYGHTHNDELEIFYDPADYKRPTSIAYIGPSVTPYVDLNPGYRIYYVDGDHNETTRQVVDHESWIMNLQQANTDDNPVWYKLYSAKAAYSMKSLRPSDWNDLVKAMRNKSELFELYYKHYWKDSPVRPTCNSDCKELLLCNAKCGRSHAHDRFCKNISKSGGRHQYSISSKIIVGLLKPLDEMINYFAQEALLLTNEVNPWQA